MSRTADTDRALQLAHTTAEALELLHAVRAAQASSVLDPWPAYLRACSRLEAALDASLTQPEQDRLLELLLDRQLQRQQLDGGTTSVAGLASTLQRQRLGD